LEKLVCKCDNGPPWEAEWNDLLGEYYLFCSKCGRILGALVKDNMVEPIPELNFNCLNRPGYKA